jgi:hypothetical protein
MVVLSVSGGKHSTKALKMSCFGPRSATVGIFLHIDTAPDLPQAHS